MPKYVVTTTLLGTETGRQEVSIPVEASSEDGARQIVRNRIGKIIAKGDASGHTSLRVKLADVQ